MKCDLLGVRIRNEGEDFLVIEARESDAPLPFTFGIMPREEFMRSSSMIERAVLLQKSSHAAVMIDVEVGKFVLNELNLHDPIDVAELHGQVVAMTNNSGEFKLFVAIETMVIRADHRMMQRGRRHMQKFC